MNIDIMEKKTNESSKGPGEKPESFLKNKRKKGLKNLHKSKNKTRIKIQHDLQKDIILKKLFQMLCDYFDELEIFFEQKTVTSKPFFSTLSKLENFYTNNINISKDYFLTHTIPFEKPILSDNFYMYCFHFINQNFLSQLSFHEKLISNFREDIILSIIYSYRYYINCSSY